MAASALQDRARQVVTEERLARLIRRWETLPEPLKDAILTIVESGCITMD